MTSTLEFGRLKLSVCLVQAEIEQEHEHGQEQAKDAGLRLQKITAPHTR
jgi:hypothetical protein